MTTDKIKFKIASASCNQTAGDWPRNLANICQAIDMAVEDGANLLCLEELGLSAYERGDDFYYSDNAKTRMMLQVIADYAASKDPNLVISVGHPWYFADKNLPSQPERRKNPIFNRTDNQFNVQSFLAGGEIVAMSAKNYLFNYERGYEGRHFQEWSLAAANAYENEHGKGREGTIRIELPEAAAIDGSVIPARVVPFGDPVLQLDGEDGRKLNLWHIICETYWIGSRFDGSPDNSNYWRDSAIAQKSAEYDIGVGVNPNISPPAANKIDNHYELCRLASQYCGVLAHTDGLGSSGSTFALFGSRLMAQKGEIISEGIRASLKDVAYTSQVVELDPAKDKGHAPHAIVPHIFRDRHTEPKQDGPAPWEKNGRREFEEEMRNEILWLFDYMRKNKVQGIAQALSGGADSAYNAAKVRLMVDLGCAELGFEGFMKAMSHLKYKDEALEVFRTQGRDAAIDKVMENMLTCVYMGTDNSSEDTLRAAKTLIEGGVTADGKPFKGIGGKFHYRNVQRLVDLYAQIYAGVNPGSLTPERDREIREELAALLRTRADDIAPQELERRIDVVKTTFEEVVGDVLSIAKEEHRVPYENIQATARLGLIKLIANVENKLPIANPNLDESRNSYATFGGDLHSGTISGNLHKNKQRELNHMKLLFEHGLEGGAEPAEAFYWVLKNRPSAELQPLGKDGKIEQFDEDQLDRSFDQMNMISYFMLQDRPLEQNHRKNNPVELFQKCQDHKFFEGDSIERLHDRIKISYDKWAISQFKIHASPIAMTYGENVDHQTSLRTPNTSAFHRPELAQLTLYCLHEMAARDGIAFEKLSGGQSYEALSMQALLDKDFADSLSAKMWRREAIGPRSRIGSLYAFVKENGLEPLQKPSPMAAVFKAASAYRRKAANTNQKVDLKMTI